MRLDSTDLFVHTICVYRYITINGVEAAKFDLLSFSITGSLDRHTMTRATIYNGHL